MQNTPLPLISRGHIPPVCLIIGSVIRRHRVARGWTPDRLAELTFLSRTMIEFLEQRKRLPSLETVERIARAFGISVTRLLAEAECARRAEGCNYSCMDCRRLVVV